MEKFTLINNDISRIKVFETSEDVSKHSPSINVVMISYGFLYKKSIKQIIKFSIVESIENAREEYKHLLEECWKKNSIFKII